MFETLENNPTLRERVLGLTAIGAVLIGGAAGVDTMLTSGWQFGGDAYAAPVIYADATPHYQDDVTRDWNTTPPQRVQLAAQDAPLTAEPAPASGGLDGATAGTVTPVAYAAAPPAPTIAPEPTIASVPQTSAEQQGAADQRFDAIEHDIQQANAPLEPDVASKDDAAAPSAGDQG